MLKVEKCFDNEMGMSGLCYPFCVGINLPDHECRKLTVNASFFQNIAFSWLSALSGLGTDLFLSRHVNHMPTILNKN